MGKKFKLLIGRELFIKECEYYAAKSLLSPRITVTKMADRLIFCVSQQMLNKQGTNRLNNNLKDNIWQSITNQLG